MSHNKINNTVFKVIPGSESATLPDPSKKLECNIFNKLEYPITIYSGPYSWRLDGKGRISFKAKKRWFNIFGKIVWKWKYQ